MTGALSCPFCPGLKIGHARRVGGRFWMRCLSCDAEGPTGRSPEEALARWNARFREEPLEKAITAIHRIVTPDQGESLSEDERAIFAVTSAVLAPPPPYERRRRLRIEP
ncbi:MAG: hypothetical protein ACK4OJ_12125 [Brevundimonas sp.]